MWPSGNLQLRLINHGRAPTVFTIKRQHTRARACSGKCAAVTMRRCTWTLRSQHAWYDLTVTASSDAGFARRLAGHVETGRVSASDPALSA
ncbi:phospholipase domain-containing protein [Cupriavidus basilensis]